MASVIEAIHPTVSTGTIVGRPELTTARAGAHGGGREQAGREVAFGRSRSPRRYRIIVCGIRRMICGKAIRMPTLMMSTRTNQPQPRNMSPMETSGATPRRT
jgi:hypothetical protein